MERGSRAILLILSALLVGCVSFAQAQEDGSLGPSKSLSASASASNSIDITDRNPCSFRGKFLAHKESLTLDPCTVCTCGNGTTTCYIESCPSEAGCQPSEIVVIPEECCPQCPYKMYVKVTNNMYDETFEFTEGSSRRIRFGLDIEVDRKQTSRLVRGENLWKLTAWVSPNEDGSGPRFSEEDNVFNEKDAGQEYLKPNYPPWEWSRLRYTMKFTGGSCVDYKYFCVQFGQADDPRPKYDFAFTFQAVDNETERLIGCVPLGECRGLKAIDLDWTIEAEDPFFGQTTPVTLDVDVKFDPESANKEGQGLWRVGLFGSTNEEGSGPRFSEIYQTLTEDEASTPKKGTKLPIEGIETDFEIGSIGCIDDASYVCVEFAQGDNPDPPFTMAIEYAKQGGAELDSMILCKPQECSALRSIPSVTSVPVCPSVLEPAYPRDCGEVQLTSASRLPSGIYEIQPFGFTTPFNVYCDFDMDYGGWTVIQRRVDGSVDFNRGWSDYKDGFGCLQSEFWLGNEKLVALTRQREYQLRIELTAKEGSPAYASYGYFRLGDESAHYRLFLGSYLGNAEDSMDHHREMNFSTMDADYDGAPGRNCATSHGGGWWFGNCDHSNLNGNYGVDGETGIEWYYHPGGSYDLKFTEMKIRAISVHSSNK